MASSFVNRVTPANVGGMALNLRFLQKAGVDPADGGHRHRAERRRRARSCTSCCSSCSSRGRARATPTASRSRPTARSWSIIAVVLALIGIAIATQLGPPHAAQARRRLPEASRGRASSCSRARPRSWRRSSADRCSSRWRTSPRSRRRSPRSTAGSASPRSARSTWARRWWRPRRRRPGASARWKPRSSPGSPASGWSRASRWRRSSRYRLATYWLPILPGWLSFQHLERHNLI